MAYSYTGKRAHDFDLGAVSFQVSDGSTQETWRVSEIALQDKFGATGISAVALFAAFDPDAAYIASVGDALRASRGPNLLLHSSDF